MRSKYEIRAEKELQEEGWLVDNKTGMGRWSKNRDYWHLFDLLAVKQGHRAKFIAIKGHVTGTVITALRGQILEFPRISGVHYELWRWPKRKKKKESWVKEDLSTNKP